MKNGIYIRAGIVRAVVLLFAMAIVVITIREIPELRRYIKAETR